MDVLDPEVVDHAEMAEQDGKSTPTDPYKNEYFNYYDSFVEHWYEPAIESSKFGFDRYDESGSIIHQLKSQFGYGLSKVNGSDIYVDLSDCMRF
ncbi:hypothetical protein KIN20_030797 [Parelaphostrongylus tenuis]|uniref:Uncharacterized protein n=1 Tax=Parelaphostrongylus tenuis TaxID=148309 RepID=A0AAD5R5R7_PARTN|nr:hypothetical protein KIN20_030797 [Parelaphostrongylus tenuis]